VVEEIRGKGRRAMLAVADVSKRDEIEAMFDRVWEELGPIDILVTMLASRRLPPFSI